MKTYLVSATVTISLSTQVEASSPEEAEALVEGRAMCTLGAPESHGCFPESHWCHSGEIDGEPENIEVEELS